MEIVQLFKNNTKVVRELECYGIISPHWRRDIQIIEAYSRLEMDCQMCKYEILAGRFRLDSDTIRKILRKFKKKV